ncbi:tetratricopeptide repeat protein [Chitinispirillales bacterium ANBcel5]|uniref:tetratricopeptide repeat protein n=1 Tax=Cellulosispirillum alkaliphilum TaxID=3039283 RepID=UPI002A51534B|nr:tetratricopeptide repeat protein [Chitinispirillales bacterium ANBcel5]
MKRTLYLLVLIHTLFRCAAVNTFESDNLNKSDKVKETIITDKEGSRQSKNLKTDTLDKFHKNKLLDAEKMVMEACANYLHLYPSSPKRSEVLEIKANMLYNRGRFGESRKIYQKIILEFPEENDIAIRMTAQSYYEEEKYDSAQLWYGKLIKEATGSETKRDAQLRMAQTLFRVAEQYEKEERYRDAAVQYKRAAREFPETEIADVSLFNTALMYEKLSQLLRAIKTLQNLIVNYENSAMIPGAKFRIGLNFEKLERWDDAAEIYLQLVSNHQDSELAANAMLNAAYCFEQSNRLLEAAATFERKAIVFHSSDNAPDVLFRAADLYGQIGDWESASRVSEKFTKRFGSGDNRLVQAHCLVGISLKNQGKKEMAIQQLLTAVESLSKIEKPDDNSVYYAAKSLFTIAQIYKENMSQIELVLPEREYRERITRKYDYLHKAIDYYTEVIQLGLLEWTTKSLYQIGETYEVFAEGLFNQERPSNVDLNKQIALELGIVEAIERYSVEQALYYHQQNVELGIKQFIEDEYISASNKKLTLLPMIAANQYLSLADIALTMKSAEGLQGPRLIAKKLDILQKVTPLQKNAINLFLKTLELGSRYKQFDNSYFEAGKKILETSLTLGDSYYEVINIARQAPVPKGLDEYERLIYKTRLLSQTEDYKEEAVESYLYGLKIAQAYNLEESETTIPKERIAQLQFEWARSYDLLYQTIKTDPPIPSNISVHEKDNYRGKFEELGKQLRREMIKNYERVLEFEQKGYTAGEYVRHAYVRLFQKSKEIYGIKKDTIIVRTMSSGRRWRVKRGMAKENAERWYERSFDDSGWKEPKRVEVLDQDHSMLRNASETAMWIDEENSTEKKNRDVYFRREVIIEVIPFNAEIFLRADGDISLFVNGTKVSLEEAQPGTYRADLLGKVQRGNNLIAVSVSPQKDAKHGLLPLLRIKSSSYHFIPQPPNENPLPKYSVRPENYIFPEIKSKLE